MGRDGTSDGEVIHTELDTDADRPAIELAKVIADSEGVAHTDLTTMYSVVDDMLVHLFENPPSPEAQMEVTFSYEGYRVTVEQNGRVELIKPN